MNLALKRLLLILSCVCLASAGFAQSQGITITKKNAKISEVLDAIEQQKGIIFVTEKDVDLDKTVSIELKNADIDTALKQLFPKNSVTWKTSGVNVYLSTVKAQAGPGGKTPASAKKPLKATGRVVDSDGEFLPGASLMVSGTKMGFMSDLEGNFTIEGISFPAEIVVSYIGYTDRKILLQGGESELSITLSNDENVLEDVVVVGYGTQKRVNVTGAVAVVDGKTLNSRPVTNTASALQGADPSLILTMSNGSIEGAQYGVSVRGSVSLNSGSPLILIDGIEGSMTQVNPNDIESVSILKDASACAIYGAKASAGVVLINTKSGAEGTSKISYNGRVGISTNTTNTDFITTAYDYVTLTNDFYQVYKGYNAWTFSDEQMQMLYERRNDATENPERPWVIDDETGLNKYVYLANFDWYGYLFKRSRPETEHNITISGGNDRVSYYTSGRYLYREGVFNAGAEDIYNGYSFRTKIDAKITPWLKSSTNISFERTSYDYGGFYEQDGNDGAVLTGHSAFYNANQNICPAYVPFNPDGSINVQPGFMADNASQLGTGRVPTWMDARNKHNRTRNYMTITNRLTATLAKGLQFIGDYTFRHRDNVATYRSLPVTNAYDNVNQRFFAAPGYTSGAVYDFYKEVRSYYDIHVINAYFQYNGSFGKHNIAATLGTNFDDSRSSGLTAMQKGSLSESLAYLNMANGTISALEESNSSYRTMGVFGRFSYNYAEKYLLELSARYDGSSRFPKGQRWGIFPSVSAGWRISQEPFWAPMKSWWNKAKLRVSYGTLGNQQVSNYYYIDRIRTANMSYTFDGKSTASYAYATNPVSDSLTWETVVSYNVGLDAGFFSDRLNLGVDVFRRDTKDMLTTSITLPDVYGAASPKANAADLSTSGYEISLSWRDNISLGGKPFSYGISGSIGDYITTITKYNNPSKLLNDYYEGKRLGEIWGYHISGLFASDEDAAAYAAEIDDTSINKGVYACAAPHNHLMAGDVIFADLNDDGIISAGSNTLDDPGDIRVIGNVLPRYNYSIRGDLSYMGFDLNLFFQGVGQCDWVPDGNCDYFWQVYRNQRPTFITKNFESLCWSEENPDSYFPRRRGQYANRSLANVNDRYLVDASYIRLKNLTFGYTIPFKTKAIAKCRVYFSGENLAYWSPMKKYCDTIDPEVATTGATNDCMYPYSKTFSFGIDITF